MPTHHQDPRRNRTPARGRAGARESRKTFFTPGASAFRQAVERRSAAPLVVLHRAPRWAIPIVMAALLLVGVGGPRWVGVFAFLALAGFLTWLCYLSWPALQARGRLLRTIAILVPLAAAAGRGVGAL